MRRAIASLAALLALIPSATNAANPPDPATLKSLLADPPSSQWIESDVGANGEGSFDANGYAKLVAPTDSTKRALFVTRLTIHGFVSGYGRLWAKTGGGAALVEQILVFGDSSGATEFYSTSKLGDLSAPVKTGTVDSSSIPNSYGVEDLISSVYSTAIVFHKGNDLLAVGFVSATTYLTSETISQAAAEYSLAPTYTIQPSGQQAIQTGAMINVGRTVALVAFGLVILALVVAAAIFMVMRSRRPAAQPVAASGTPLVNMSSDGRYWWDGAGWQDAAVTAPGHAARSADGEFWWDGLAWHTVPKPI